MALDFDMEVLEPGLVEEAAPVPALKRLRARHHALARALAAGMETDEAAIVCGYTKANVGLLLRDPAFQDLMAFYRKKAEDAFTGVLEKTADLAESLIDEMAHRVENEPEKLSFTQLKDAAAVMLDRAGYGPKSTQEVNVNVNMADRLQAARERVRRNLLIEQPVVEVA